MKKRHYSSPFIKPPIPTEKNKSQKNAAPGPGKGKVGGGGEPTDRSRRDGEHVLVEGTRRLALQATDLADAPCGTIRRKLFIIGALVTISVHRIRRKKTKVKN